MFSKEQVTAFLRKPAVDKVLGLLAASPAFYTIYLFYEQTLLGSFDIYRAGLTLNAAVILITVFIRRTAKRVSLRPLFWAITFGRNYWAYLVVWYTYQLPTVRIAPLALTNVLLILATAVIIYSRISLGRNIGFLPAQREIVTTGAYGYVRHPIHTAELLFFAGFLLSQFSALNAFLLLIGAAFVINKSLIEETFLKDDAEYAEYCRRVRYRWVPGII